MNYALSGIYTYCLLKVCFILAKKKKKKKLIICFRWRASLPPWWTSACKVDSNIELSDSLIYDFVESLIKLMVYDGVSKVHMSHFVQKGHPWEGIEEIRRVKCARPQLPRPILIKDGRAY